MRIRIRITKNSVDRGIVFHTIPFKTWQTEGQWFSISSPLSRCTHMTVFPNIWYESRPLAAADNVLTEEVVSLLEDEDFQCWIDCNALQPLILPPWLNIRVENSTCTIELKGADLDAWSRDLLAFKLMLDCVGCIWNSGLNPRSMISWASTDEPQEEYPAPRLLFSPSNVTRHDITAALQVMRHIGPYEAGTDFISERRFKCAFALLFKDCNVAWLPGTDCIAPPMDTQSPRYPFIVAGGSSDLTEQVEVEMAQLAEPTLLQFVKSHGDSNAPLPEYCFLYGIHWSRSVLSIYAHFPSHLPTKSDAGANVCDDRYDFHQVLLAHHRLVPRDTGRGNEYQDDRFLDRWQLLVALLTIRSHVLELQKRYMSAAVLHHTVFSTQLRTIPGPAPFNVDRRPQLPDYLTCIRRHWRQKFRVPWNWLPQEECIIRPTREARYFRDMVAMEIPNLLLIYLYPVRHLIQPISEDELWSNHCSEDYFGPDFLHALHVPRNLIDTEWLEVEDLNKNTMPHLNRFYDLLTMTTETWSDINLFIASAFSSFSEYSVIWNPCMKYPFEIKDTPSSTIVTDFALAVQKIPATTKDTIKRAPLLPLTLSTPAVLLGLRSSIMDESQSGITEAEISEIESLTRPHLQLLIMHLRHQAGGQDGTVTVPPWALVFSTYLTAGQLHILASSPDTLNADFGITTYLVDSLHFQRMCSSDEELVERLQLAIALFTLQRHVVRVASQLTNIWPQELLEEEHRAIVQVTGIATPAASMEYTGSEDDTTSQKRELMERAMYGERVFSRHNSNASTTSSECWHGYQMAQDDSDDSDDGGEVRRRVQDWLQHIEPSAITNAPMSSIKKIKMAHYSGVIGEKDEQAKTRGGRRKPNRTRKYRGRMTRNRRRVA